MYFTRTHGNCVSKKLTLENVFKNLRFRSPDKQNRKQKEIYVCMYEALFTSLFQPKCFHLPQISLNKHKITDKPMFIMYLLVSCFRLKGTFSFRHKTVIEVVIEMYSNSIFYGRNIDFRYYSINSRIMDFLDFLSEIACKYSSINIILKTKGRD